MARLRTISVGELMAAGCWEKFLEHYETESGAAWASENRVTIFVEHAIEWGLIEATY